MTPIIELTHLDKGPMKVRIASEHTAYLGGRQWTDVNSDGRVYDETWFEETPAEVDALLEAAKDAERAADELHYESECLANYCSEQIG